jgi:hypothetical protein
MSHKFKIGDIVKLKHYPPQPLGDWDYSFLDHFKNLENKFTVTSLGTYNFRLKSDLCITVDNISYGGWNPEEAFELYQEPESLIGRYLEVLIDCANGTSYKKGEHILIEGINSSTQIYCSRNFVFSHVDNDFSMCYVKLMPVGFNPNAVKQPYIEELLAEATRRYPIDTRYIPLSTEGGKYQNVYSANRPPKALSNGIELGVGYVYLFNKPGVWAEVISYPVKTEVVKEWVPKVDDYVIGWFNNYNTQEQYHLVPWQVGKVKDKYVYPKKNLNHNTDIKFVRLATPEELKKLNNDFKSETPSTQIETLPITPEKAYKFNETNKKEQAFDDPVIVKKVKVKKSIKTI